MQNNTIYLKTDDNKIINERQIRWVKKMGDCLEVCTRSVGCSPDTYAGNTHKICKLNSPYSYNKLIHHFE